MPPPPPVGISTTTSAVVVASATARTPTSPPAGVRIGAGEEGRRGVRAASVVLRGVPPKPTAPAEGAVQQEGEVNATRRVKVCRWKERDVCVEKRV